ncbi:MAG TPA: hypothetical protein ENK24_04500 [Anaerolineae bacterium]|nr:hypothetical protein [Anaerolineae bacterium]
MRAVPLNLILLDRNFDECAAAAFTAALRRSGRRVKLTAVTASVRGAVGVGIVPDMLLGEALAASLPIRHLILPLSYINGSDPRLTGFLSRAAGEGVEIVAAPGLVSELRELGIDGAAIREYPAEAEDIFEFARVLAQQL